MTVFETTTCSRCGGSGSYSYCQMYGSTCFKCAGTRKQLTKKGAAAREFFRASMTKPASVVAVGDKVFMNGKWRTVIEIKPSNTTAKSLQPDGTWVEHKNFIELSFKNNYGYILTPTTEVQSIKNEDERQALIKAALAYQDTLTA